MNLSPLIDVLKQDAKALEIEKHLAINNSVNVIALEESRPFTVAGIYKALSRPLLIVSPTLKKAAAFKERLESWLGSDTCMLFPEPETLPYQKMSDDRESVYQRLEVLASLSGHANKSTPLVVITSARALASKTISRSDYLASWQTINTGDEIDPLQLVRHFQKLGYQSESIVANPGEVSLRGGIVDIFPVNSQHPVRIDFFGNTIEEMRIFNPESQLSLDQVELASVGPATELQADGDLRSQQSVDRIRSLDTTRMEPGDAFRLEEDLEKLSQGQTFHEMGFYNPVFCDSTILDHIPDDGIIVMNDAQGIQGVVDSLVGQENKSREDYLEKAEIPQGFPVYYNNWDYIQYQLGYLACLYYYNWQDPKIIRPITPGFKPAKHYDGMYSRFIEDLKTLRAEKAKVVIVSHQAERLAEILYEAGIIAKPVENVPGMPEPGQIMLVKGILNAGFKLEKDFFLFTDVEVFGFVKQNRRIKRYKPRKPDLLSQARPGDYVVHVDHGIALFSGVTTFNDKGVKREYIVLEYEGEDRLYVPVEQIDRVERYIGGEDKKPVLNKLGTNQWQRTKEKTAEATREIAAELLGLYSQRQLIKGFRYSPDTVWQKELESSFPYLETPDQLEAITDIKRDMGQDKPMDRLLLGDVGYGKTEVAIRAAFKAVQDGRQVAVLVPTTLLAQQHFITFKQRLGVYPVIVESLSRFQSERFQQEIVAKTKEGGVDIVIGTHRLLQKDVAFKNLGLIIIDEEQRFGVKHKEHLKRKRNEVDVLTLSATPIPRTLHMSLSGVRDLSTIETPPEERLPVNTSVVEYSPHLIREVVLKELERGGQVFFVHNRVHSIHIMYTNLKEILPEANIGIAHGRMSEEDLERTMTGFTSGDIDVLLCTTIIESGLDVPNANTLIVNQADKLGLIQLHQLRGRVGRGTNTGYAYFVYDKGKMLTGDARKRLQTIYELAELGSGYSIALRDLEIRGAGTLLGTDQSGHISAVGFNMYTQLLSSAIQDQKMISAGKKPAPEANLPDPVINLPLSGLIPETYISDEALRLSVYKRLVGINEPGQLDNLHNELADRFGEPPGETDNLFYIARIKIMAKVAGVSSVVEEQEKIILTPYEGLKFSKEHLESIVARGVRFHPNRIVLETKHRDGWRVLLEKILAAGITGVQNSRTD